MDSVKLRKELHKCVPVLSLDLVRKEQTLFTRMLYRSKNQHRRDVCYQKLVGVAKRLSKYFQVAIGTVDQVKSVVKLLADIKTVWTGGPNLELLQAVAVKLTEYTSFIAHLLEFIETTFVEVHQRLKMNLFVSTFLIFSASLSRFWFCLRYHLLGLSKAYTVVRTVLSIASPGNKFPADVWKQLDKEKQKKYMGLTRSSKDSTTSLALSSSSQVDIGVAVSLTAEENLARKKDFNVPSSLTHPLSQEPQSRVFAGVNVNNEPQHDESPLSHGHRTGGAKNGDDDDDGRKPVVCPADLPKKREWNEESERKVCEQEKKRKGLGRRARSVRCRRLMLSSKVKQRLQRLSHAKVHHSIAFFKCRAKRVRKRRERMQLRNRSDSLFQVSSCKTSFDEIDSIFNSI